MENQNLLSCPWTTPESEGKTPKARGKARRRGPVRCREVAKSWPDAEVLATIAFMRVLPALFFSAGLLLLGTGCIEAMLTNGEIEGPRRGAAAMDTVADFELARSATQAGLAQFEGMHRIAPKNEDALFLLTQGWGGYAWGFVEDEMEIARDRGDDGTADYHRDRAHMAYDRAIFYGLELLGHEADGFAAASKN